MWVTREHIEYMVKEQLALYFNVLSFKSEQIDNIVDHVIELYPYKIEKYGEGDDDYITFYDISQVSLKEFETEIFNILLPLK